MGSYKRDTHIYLKFGLQHVQIDIDDLRKRDSIKTFQWWV